VCWFDGGAGTEGRLLLVLHHLVVDGVSWRVLLADLAQAGDSAAAADAYMTAIGLSDSLAVRDFLAGRLRGVQR
jgi:hypothetical protein